MIRVSRFVIRTFRAVARRAAKRAGASRGTISFHADETGLRLRANIVSIALEHHEPSNFPKEELALASDALAEFEGRDDECVTLERSKGDLIRAQWHDGVVPQTKEYEAFPLDRLQPWPKTPEQMSPADSSLWPALADAAESAAAEQHQHYALTDVQLSGSTGEVIATNGHELLIRSGLKFPWSQDLLVPATTLFGCREFDHDGNLLIGRTDDYVTFQTGPWIWHLLVDKSAKFPKVKDAIPALTGKYTRWHIDAGDAEFLTHALPRLPGAKDDNAPITVDLNGQSLIRARGTDQPDITELVLAHSSAVDKSVRFVVDRHLLLRALGLRFTDFSILGADKAMQCQDSDRRFVFMPIQSGAVIPASDKATRISSDPNHETVPVPPIPPERSQEDMRTSTTPNGSSANGTNVNGTDHRDDEHGSDGQNHAGYGALIAEAEAVKTDLRDLLVRVNQLVIAIRRHRKQAQGVQTMISNLRQLEKIGS